MMRAILTNKFM